MTNIMSMRDLGRAIETKFAKDQELEFKVEAQTQILIAEWAAERIGLDPDSSRQFVLELSEWGLKPGNRDLKARLMLDFSANSVEISENALEKLIELKSQQARRKIMNS
ncbi:MAG: hypothetical protein AUJ12_06370 [Alphaproteobacteria bacterium CG1_02_46_17]|nr:MAG: hypothetical protein AUJ12_06370 [Alphaproteobacteria bacterium CG1_02_46_17]